MADTKVLPKRPSEMLRDRKSASQANYLMEQSSSESSESEQQKDDEAEDDEKAEGEGDEYEKKHQVGKGLAKSVVHIDRDEYLQAHRDLTHDKNQLQIKNNILHRRLSEYYKKRKLDHVLKPLEGSMDLEEKYQQKLLAYEELKEKEEREGEHLKQKLHEVNTLYENQEQHALAKFKVLQDHERNTGANLIYAKKGKPISEKTVHRFLSLQKTKTATASAMMLRYIRVRNAVMEQEAIIRKLERIGPGLYVAQYEQLRVDKLNFTSKIEERDDELIRNRLKCTEHNQMLAHIREKMHHTTEIIDITECDLGEAEIDYQKAREELSEVKTRRDRLRINTENERLKAGLITKRMLLRDFQDAIDMVEKLRDRKAYLEHQIRKHNLELREARRCITYNGPATPSEDIFGDMP